MTDKVKLNLGCGDRAGPEGFLNVDICKTSVTDIVCDLFQFPWPFEDESVEEVYSSHFFEHIPAKLRPKFMDELYRVLVPGGLVGLSVPAYNSQRAYQDFTHEWPPIVPNSFLYFNKEWREINHLLHGDYDMKCNFKLKAGATMTDDWKERAQEVQQFAGEHYWNATNDIVINLIKE